ncbi:hypothetical protein EDC04DRAFT_781023 [Pisolithus marmoratus]|nr:hypothetical protein EDC04DRAFT_781023 [Pisolithus marmoratus]
MSATVGFLELFVFALNPLTRSRTRAADAIPYYPSHPPYSSGCDFGGSVVFVWPIGYLVAVSANFLLSGVVRLFCVCLLAFPPVLIVHQMTINAFWCFRIATAGRLHCSPLTLGDSRVFSLHDGSYTRTQSVRRCASPCGNTPFNSVCRRGTAEQYVVALYGYT